MYNKSTYTFGTLKKSIYKALEEYSLNGKAATLADGMTADIEKRFIASLNMCARRVSLSLPYLTKKAEMVFDKGIAFTPEDCERILSVKTSDGRTVHPAAVKIVDDKIYCDKAENVQKAEVVYRVAVNQFTAETGEDEKINLPDISADALVYLTAAELCPTEYSELYSRLMFKYRDIALNCYNAEEKPVSRNTFYSGCGRKFTR